MMLFIVLLGTTTFSVSIGQNLGVCPSNYSYCVKNFTEQIAKPLNISVAVGNETNEYCNIKNTIKFYNLKMHILYSMNGGNKNRRRKARTFLKNNRHINQISQSSETVHLGSNICDIDYSKLQIEKIKYKLEKENYLKINKKEHFVSHFVILYFAAVIIFYRGRY